MWAAEAAMMKRDPTAAAEKVIEGGPLPERAPVGAEEGE
jgi:hypothetical protein